MDNGKLIRRKIAISIVFALLLSAVLVSAFHFPKTLWYDVADWERRICQIAGPTKDIVASSVTPSINYISQITVSLQAQRTEHPDGTELYEIAWYMMPLQGALTYELKLSGIGDRDYLDGILENSHVDFGPRASQSTLGDADFAAFTLDGRFNATEVIMEYEGGPLRVPIVLVE